MTPLFQPPRVIKTQTLARLPDSLRKPSRSGWAAANKPGQTVDSFLEGPAFDRQGNLYLTDIPNGRILRLDTALRWDVAAETGGWPNGIAIDRDGSLWVADYRLGLLRVQPDSGGVEAVLGHRNSESFRGLNDLHFDARGNLYFTDQGQTGMHDPSGRVYRLRPSGQLDLLLSNCPSPNGLTTNAQADVLFVSMTRANAVWRVPLLADGSVSKVGVFQSFFGVSGPDGMAMDAEGRLIVAHASLGGAFALSPRGDISHVAQAQDGASITNMAFRPGTSTMVITESRGGAVLQADMPAAGAPLWAHQETP
jgi:gluconolactonase